MNPPPNSVSATASSLRGMVQQAGAAPETGVDVMRVLAVTAHPDYEALALDEFVRAGFAHRSELATSLDALRQLLEGTGAGDAWDIVLVIDTPDGPPAGQVLELLARHIADTPVIFVGRCAALQPPPELLSVRMVDLRSVAGAAADALREIERRRERRRGAQALRASEIRFSTAFESAPIGLALVRLDGRFLGVNPVFCAIAGRERDAIVAASSEEVADDDLLSCVRAAAERLTAGADDRPVQRRCIRADGTPIWIRVSAAPARNDGGESLYMVVHVEDVTGKLEAELARERSELLFGALFTSTNVGMCIVDSDGRFVETNQAYEEIVGYSGDELKRMSFVDVTHPDDVAANLSLFSGQIERDAGYRLEKRYVRKDGSIVWVELSGAPLRDRDGHLVIGAVVDITERKKVAAALEESARILATTRTISGLGSWVATRATPDSPSEISWSDEMFQILGLDAARDEATVEKLYELVHPDDRAELRNATNAAVEGIGVFDIEFCIVRPDGQTRRVRACADRFADEGRGSRLVGVMLDLTDVEAARA